MSVIFDVHLAKLYESWYLSSMGRAMEAFVVKPPFTNCPPTRRKNSGDRLRFRESPSIPEQTGP